MAREEVIRNVPADQVDRVVQQFKADRATKVDVKDNGNGTFDITATLPTED